MVATHPVALIGGQRDGEVIQLDRSLWAVRVPHPSDPCNPDELLNPTLGFDLYNVIPASVFGRVVFVAKTGGRIGTNEDLARVLLKPEVFEAWQAGRSYP